MNWMSLARDQNRRVYSPVKISSENGFVNVVNSFKEWNWEGDEPIG